MTTAVAGARADTRQLCTFFVDDLFFGVEVLQVQEVIRHQEMTQVPLAPREVSGLINLRGQIVTALDLRRRLGLPDRPARAPEDASDEVGPLNVVVHTPDGPVSLLVDEIGDVLEVLEEDREPAPPTLDARARELISGIYKLEGRLLLVLDVDRATTTAS
jgi:purine-binding chemotaxis protein CheW